MVVNILSNSEDLFSCNSLATQGSADKAIYVYASDRNYGQIMRMSLRWYGNGYI